MHDAQCAHAQTRRVPRPENAAVKSDKNAANFVHNALAEWGCSMYNVLVNLLAFAVKRRRRMLFSELAKRVAEKYPEVKTAFPMDCELSNVELYDPNGAIPPVDTLGIYTARQISEDMTLPLCFVCAGTPDQTAHDKIAYSDSNYIIIPQVSAVDVVYYIMSLFGDSFKQQKLYSNLIYMLLNDADLTSVFCEFSKGTGSQMLAIDISGKVLAYSKPFRVNHPHWIHSIEVGYLDNYLIEYILSYRVKHKMDMSPNTFVLFCNRLQMYIKVIRVIADNEIIGYVFMGNYTGEFPWFSDKLMHLLAKKLHSTLLGSRSYSTYRFNMHQSVLSDIIEGASEDETIQRINAAKLTFPPNMRAVVLKPSYFRGNEYLYDVLTPRVAEILPASPRVYKKKMRSSHSSAWTMRARSRRRRARPSRPSRPTGRSSSA